VLVKPYLVERVLARTGAVLEQHQADASKAMDPAVAFVLASMMEGVVDRGTAGRLADLPLDIAGKTGTTNDYTDAWFTGFDPNTTVGVWIGHDDKKPLGPAETGAAAALPIWIDFVKAYIDLRGDRRNPPAFQPPGNIVFVSIDRASGQPLAGDTPGAINEAFIAGTQPGGIR
jgi:penicillin-binding protein 1A